MQAYFVGNNSRSVAMSECKSAQGSNAAHAHPGGRRCCGRPLSEKCNPEEEAAKTDKTTGEKSCCKGHHKD